MNDCTTTNTTNVPSFARERTAEGIKLQTPLQVYRIDMRCPECKLGLMRGTGHGITSLKTDWQNKCSRCGFTAWYDESYPTTEYMEAGERTIKSDD